MSQPFCCKKKSTLCHRVVPGVESAFKLFVDFLLKSIHLHLRYFPSLIIVIVSSINFYARDQSQ